MDGSVYIGTANFKDKSELIAHVNKVGGELLEIIEQYNIIDKVCSEQKISSSKSMAENKPEQSDGVASVCHDINNMPFLIKWYGWNSIAKSIFGGIILMIALVITSFTGGLNFYYHDKLVRSVWISIFSYSALVLFVLFYFLFGFGLLIGQSWTRKTILISSWAGICLGAFMLIKSFITETEIRYIFWISEIVFCVFLCIFDIWYFSRKKIKALYAMPKLEK